MTGRIVTLVFALLVLRPVPADACSCYRHAACEVVFFQTVFVGKVTSVVQTRPGGYATTTFRVLDTLHSAFSLPKTITIKHDTDGSSCGISFAKGTTYVVYAGGDSVAELMVGACGNTHVLRKNDPDVALVKNKPTRTTALVEGKAVLIENGDHLPLSGIEVRAGGRRATTDADGVFTLELPVGSHRVEIDKAGVRAYDGQTFTIQIPSVAVCPKPTFQYLYDGRIEGTVTGADGKPVEDLEVSAIGAGPDKGKFRGRATTDAQGHYMFHELSEGTYQVGVSLPDNGGPGVMSPYPTTLYPKSITLQRSGLVSKIDLALPAALKRVTFKGIVRRADGTPVKKAFIVVDTGTHAGGDTADENGAYTAVELAGSNVTIKACDGDTCVEVKRAKISKDETIDITVK